MARVRALEVNGCRHLLDVDPERSLLSVLREELDLTGTQRSCGEGACGACTVVVDCRAMHACITPVRDAAGRPVLTIEGLERAGQLHPLQVAFLETGALQCGYCTPGMIMAGSDLLKKNPDPSEEEVREALAGNLCRCTGYHNIVKAVMSAAERMREHEEVGA